MSGHHESFERLIERYEKRIYNVALRLSSNIDEAAELTQETFIRAYRAWGRFRGDAHEYTWLYRILVNLNKDRLAKRQKQREREFSLEERVEAEQGREIPDDRADMSSAASNAELREMLEKAIRDLPDGYRECLILKDMEGLTYEEIAQTLELTVEAVRSRLARARQQMRQALTPYLKT